jgi:hypothetical protein
MTGVSRAAYFRATLGYKPIASFSKIRYNVRVENLGA